MPSFLDGYKTINVTAETLDRLREIRSQERYASIDEVLRSRFALPQLKPLRASPKPRQRLRQAWPWAKMEVGDKVFIDGKTIAEHCGRMFASLYTYRNRHKEKCFTFISSPDGVQVTREVDGAIVPRYRIAGVPLQAPVDIGAELDAMGSTDPSAGTSDVH